ncbi:hypothetical protein NQ315_009810 [Exocentrus adspersus]|uniref:Uncharacterized protein n=1 Tax=Exocentrus adspersus TaxID=1586481 RepID=A0AAV8WI82_9CUCU|nr:hypothetical protein NQ315_009810 [Exocentrus adspersus]
MTVNKVQGTSTTSKTKKKSASSTTAASTSKTSTTKTSKVVGGSSTTKTHTTGNLSKSSSSSSLQISDVSHLPLNANVVTYMVTEPLPTGTGEKITTYGETGPTSTEYRHFIAQDSSSKHSTDIQQLSSTLNQSITNLNQSTSNLSQVSNSTYTVTEPVEELKLTYNKNDSGWNGKFVYEQPVQKGKKTKNQIVKGDSGTTVEQSSTSTSHQESSSKVHSSSSSYAVEIVDGKERVIDKQQHEAQHATQSSNDEYLATRSGTNIAPEVHYTQKAKDSETRYDTAVPELQKPKTTTSEASREVHQVGDQTSSSANITHDNTISDSSKHSIRDNTTDFLNTERIDGGGTSSVTTTRTYYDSKGNIVKTVTDVDTQKTPASKKTQSKDVDKRKTHVISDSTIVDDIKNFIQDTTHVDTSKIRAQQTTTDSRDFYGHRMDSADTMVKNTYDTSAIQNTIGTKGHIIKDNTIDSTNTIYSNDRNYGKTGWNGQFTYEQPGPETSNPKPTERKPSPSRKPEPKKRSDSPSKKTTREDTTVYLDQNYADTNKMRESQTTTDSRDFYGHRIDSTDTMVKNTYDTSAIQNTIGTKGHIMKDDTIDSTNIIYSNDRPVTSNPKPTERKPSPSRKPEPKKRSDSPSKKTTREDTTVYLDQNYVDTNKMRESQTTTDSRDFYGHRIDSADTMVKNTYDTSAIQNTIGTKGHIMKDDTIDSTNIIYSNDRNYGKTGWNGTFTYEQPKQAPQKNSFPGKETVTFKKT